MQFWTKEEYLKFADEMMEKPREFLMFEILYWTGIREGEMLALMPSAFDLSRGTMRIDKSYQRFDGRDVITDPKTPKSIRTIKLSKFLVEEIADYLKRHPEICPNDRMFPVTKYQISRAMKSGCQKSGVKKIRAHDLRHSHVSLLIDKGFAALAITERMGHGTTDIRSATPTCSPRCRRTWRTRSMTREEDSKCSAPTTAGADHLQGVPRKSRGERAYRAAGEGRWRHAAGVHHGQD